MVAWGALKEDFGDVPTNEACHVVRNAPKPDGGLG
jgi:hypothetical protein